MWATVYKSMDRLKELASQIDPNLQAEFTSLFENESNAEIEVEGKTSGLLHGLLGISGKGKGNKKGKRTTELKGIVTPESIINSIEKYFPNSSYSRIDQNNKALSTVPLKNLILFSGVFKIGISGKTHLERINNFHKQDYITLVGKFDHVNVNIFTSRSRYLNNDPEQKVPTSIAHALKYNSRDLHIDGFGTLLKRSEKEIEITPLFFGCQF
jgi:hypothetical protein